MPPRTARCTIAAGAIGRRLEQPGAVVVTGSDMRRGLIADLDPVATYDKFGLGDEPPMHIEARLQQLGLALPGPVILPPGVRLPFAFVRVRGDRAFVSGHGPQNADGSFAPPFGKLGREVSVEDGYRAARLTALSILGSLKRELRDLDRVRAWLRVFGMVASASGFSQQPAVINGCSDLLIELYGADAGSHARSAVGMAELPFNIPVEIEAEVEISE